MEHPSRMKDYRQRVSAALDRYSAAPDSTLFSAMRYSLLPPGKCVRPIVLLEFNRLCGGDEAAAMPFACALEMLHSYSLIHDDLPCMDNDDMRRGRPSNHKVYGEDMALLAGSSLLSLAFETALSPENPAALPPKRALRAAYTLARASGAMGMAGGQAMDIRFDAGMDLPLLYARKTGALFCAAARAGCELAGADEALTDTAERYGTALGFAFQLADDLLDAQEDDHSLFCVKGADWCRERLRQLTEEACGLLRPLPKADFLLWLTETLAGRDA